MYRLLFPSILLLIFGSLLPLSRSFAEEKAPLSELNNITIGMPKEALNQHYDQKDIRTFRREGNKEWITYNYKKDGKTVDTITFYLEDEMVEKWVLDDRDEVVKEYLGEFADGILLGHGKIRTALLNALAKLPKDVFLDVTERSRPLMFMGYYTGGIARFANSIEYTVRREDAPTFTEGFYLIKLGDELNTAEDVGAIEGIILHEIAHRVLEHLKEDEFSCAFEIEANRLVKAWGYAEEYKKASDEFGAKDKSDSPCFDYKPEKESGEKEDTTESPPTNN